MNNSESQCRSGGMEPPVDEAMRSSDGMAVIAELRTRAIHEKQVAESLIAVNEEFHRPKTVYVNRGAREQTILFLEWLDELSGCDAASTGFAPKFTPFEFVHEMNQIARDFDTEGSHCEADQLMCDLLTSLGYGEGVKIFRDMDKWYA